MSVLLRIEGMNFQNTLFDTDDLSTGRGASLAYLAAPAVFGDALMAQRPDLQVEVVYTGASGGVFAVTGCDAPTLDGIVTGLLEGWKNATEGDIPAIYRHLCFAAAAVEVADGYGAAENLAQAIIRKRQMQSASMDVPDPRLDNAGRCRIDQFRPADGGMVTTGAGKRPVSQSVRTRRDYGRTMRQAFYRRELADILPADAEGVIPEQFAGSFQDIVANPPRGLPESVQGKMAVLYLDGNGFGKARRAALGGDGPVDFLVGVKSAQGFSDHVLGRRRALLLAVLTRLGQIAKHDAEGLAAVYCIGDGDGNDAKFRLETLLWGGDEMMFVFPAWLLESVLDCVAENLCDPAWKLPSTGEMLTHGGGVVVCNAKTPIREVRDLVCNIADKGKAHAKKGATPFSGFSYLILESEAPPANIDGWRRAFYNTDDASAFTLDFASGYRSLTRLIAEIKTGDLISRGQVYSLLRQARAKACQPGHTRQDDIALIEDWIENTAVFGEKQKEVIAALRREPAFGGAVEPMLAFKRLAELWDYVAEGDYSASAHTAVAALKQGEGTNG